MHNTIFPILTLLVDNEFGVLVRVSSQIRREGWNIKSLAVAETTDPAVSRLTLSLECFAATLQGVLHKLARLQCVRNVSYYDPARDACREMALLRVPEENWAAAEPVAAAAGARLLSQGGGYRMLELCAEPEELTRRIAALGAVAAVEAARTGAVTLEKTPQQEAEA